MAGCEQTGDSGTATTLASDPTPTRVTSPPSISATAEDTTQSERIQFQGGDTESFQAALSALAEAQADTLSIAEGRYRFDAPDPNQAATPFFTLPQAEDVLIEGNGATIVFGNPLPGGIGFQGGSDITVRNLTLDYDPLPFTQGVVREVSRDERSVRLEIDAGYPPLSHGMY